MSESLRAGGKIRRDGIIFWYNIGLDGIHTLNSGGKFLMS